MVVWLGSQLVELCPPSNGPERPAGPSYRAALPGRVRGSARSRRIRPWGGAGPGGGSDQAGGAGAAGSVSAGGISGTRAPRGVWAEQTFKSFYG